MRSILPMLLGLLSSLSISAFADDNFILSTTSFPENGKIPTQYTCDGKNTSPELHWKGVPAKTESFVLILSDPDAPGETFYHWVLYNIPKSTTVLPEGVTSLPTGTLVGKNGFTKTQYSGPCPPTGKIHHYVFTLYALDTATLDITAGETAEAVLQAMQVYVLDKTVLNGEFNH